MSPRSGPFQMIVGTQVRLPASPAEIVGAEVQPTMRARQQTVVIWDQDRRRACWLGHLHGLSVAGAASVLVATVATFRAHRCR